jgi:hypothetical protein
MVWTEVCTNSGEHSSCLAMVAGIQSIDEEAFISYIESPADVQPTSAISGG